LRERMKTRRLRNKNRRCSDWVKDRAVITAVLLAVTVVFLLVGFSGPSVEMRFPGSRGWLYLGIVIVAAAIALIGLFSI